MLDSSTVVNLRYGYNYFVRGTDTNPANHGFDLTSLGFPASYNSAIPDDIRRFPRFDIAGVPGHRVRRRVPAEHHATRSSANLNKSMGSHSLRSGLEFRRYAETSEFFANNQTGQFNFDGDWTKGPLDNSQCRAEPAGPVVRRVPARAADLRHGGDPGELRRVVLDLGLLSCRTTGRLPAG